MDLSLIINSLGLVLDIVGALSLFFFGLPPKIDPDGHIYIVTGGIDQEEVEKSKKYKFCSYLGIGFLLVGFIFQLIGNFI